MLRWTGDQYIEEANRTYGQRVQAVGYEAVSDVRKNISTPSRTVTMSTTRTGKAKKVLGPRGSNRSKPGGWVHKDYGNLRTSMAQQFEPIPDRPTARVGSPSKVARWIELGTKKMAPRKQLRATLAENRQKYADMIIGSAR